MQHVFAIVLISLEFSKVIFQNPNGNPLIFEFKLLEAMKFHN